MKDLLIGALTGAALVLALWYAAGTGLYGP